MHLCPLRMDRPSKYVRAVRALRATGWVGGVVGGWLSARAVLGARWRAVQRPPAAAVDLRTGLPRVTGLGGPVRPTL